MAIFQPLADEAHIPVVLEMMRALYTEDTPERIPDAAGFLATIRHLLAAPHAGQIVLFQADETVCGYAVIIPYWSNEFGGNLVFVDELFVQPFARNRGLATAFFQTLRENPPFNAVALALEVSPANARARRLYKNMGFRPRSYSTLVCSLGAEPNKLPEITPP